MPSLYYIPFLLEILDCSDVRLFRSSLLTRAPSSPVGLRRGKRLAIGESGSGWESSHSRQIGHAFRLPEVGGIRTSFLIKMCKNHIFIRIMWLQSHLYNGMCDCNHVFIRKRVPTAAAGEHLSVRATRRSSGASPASDKPFPNTPQGTRSEKSAKYEVGGTK